MGFTGCSALAVRKFLLSAAFLVKTAIRYLSNHSATRDFKNSPNIYEDYKHIKYILGRYDGGETSLLV